MKIFDFFNKLNVRSSKIVGVFISSKSTIEVVQFDTNSHTVLNYDKGDLPYDLVARQVNQIYLIESNITKMFEIMNIPLNTPTVLSLPTVLMGHQTLPVELSDDEIKMALVSEAERNYIFRKQDPLLSWSQVSADEDAGSQYLLYSAIQKEQIDSIAEITKKIGLNLIAVDSSYAALVRGLSLTGITEEEIREERQWCVLVITQNSFVIISLIGNKIIDISEDPLAIKSFNPEDIYPNIASYSIESIINKNPEHIVIISQSNDVSAEVLCTYFDLTCKVSFLEENSFCQNPLFPMPDNSETGASGSISLEAVGSAYWNISDIPVNFNFLDLGTSGPGKAVEFSIKGKPVKLSPAYVEMMLLRGFIALVIVLVTIWGICFFINQGLANTKVQYSVEVAKLESQITAQESSQQVAKVDISDFIRIVYDKNGKLLESYNSIGSTIPEKLWIETLEVNDSLGANIKGKSYSVEDIINYFQSLNKISRFENLKISTIKVVDQAGNPTSSPPPPSAPAISGSLVPPGMPELPSLPGLSTPESQKYYEFSFATPNFSTDGSTAAPATAPGGANPNPPADEPAGSPELGRPGLPSGIGGQGR